jgi:hypothetical protein
VEGDAVCGIDGHVDGALDEALVGEVDQREDLLVVDVGCACQRAFQQIPLPLVLARGGVRWYLVWLATSPNSSTK